MSILFVTPRNVSQIGFAPTFPSLLNLHFLSYPNSSKLSLNSQLTTFFSFSALCYTYFASLTKNPTPLFLTQGSCWMCLKNANLAFTWRKHFIYILSLFNGVESVHHTRATSSSSTAGADFKLGLHSSHPSQWGFHLPWVLYQWSAQKQPLLWSVGERVEVSEHTLLPFGDETGGRQRILTSELYTRLSIDSLHL